MTDRRVNTPTIYFSDKTCWICGKQPAAVTKPHGDGACLRCYVRLLKAGWKPNEELPDTYIALLSRVSQRKRSA